jgi:hypothetical protein
MNHQHFNEWLLSEETLTPAQDKELRFHLRTCESCQMLTSAWEQVQIGFQTSHMVSPQPGFVARWQERQALHQEEAHRRQTIIAISVSAGVAALCLTLLLLYAIPSLPPLTELIVRWVESISNVFTLVRGINIVGEALLRTLPGVVPTSWWINISVGLCALVMLWIAAYRNFSLQGVYK